MINLTDSSEKKSKPPVRAKTRKRILAGIKTGVQVLFFLFLPSAFSSAFAGIKYIFTQLGLKQQILFIPFIQVLIALCLFTIIFGRFFCGFACAFGSLGDWIHLLYIWICKKWKKKPVKMGSKTAYYLSFLKYAVLAAIVILCYLGIYNQLGSYSPWNVFSLIRAGNFHLSGFVPGLILLVLILIGMAMFERFFCRFLCPMGAIFSLLPVLHFFSIHRNRSGCINGCRVCRNSCPCGIYIPYEKDKNVFGECLQCQKCTVFCPRQNIQGSRFRLKGSDIRLILIRAAILGAMLYFLLH